MHSPRYLAAVAVVVPDYDEAIAYFTRVFGFELLEDRPMGPGKRWVTVGHRNASAALVLARAANDEQRSRIGNQTGGRVFLFLHTDDFERDYQRMRSLGVKFHEAPRDETYGRVVVLEDCYGNKWDLIEPKR
jgi:catechol 2,3-dioxygenase-like lactoylglutathione lyase family enzyme